MAYQRCWNIGTSKFINTAKGNFNLPHITRERRYRKVNRKQNLALVRSSKHFYIVGLTVALTLAAGNIVHAQGKLYHPRNMYVQQQTIAQKDSAEPSRQSLGPWQVKYNLSGGIAGIIRELTLNSDGQLIAVDSRNNIRKEISASPDQLGEVKKLLENLQTASENVPKPTQNCFDCLNSKITITLDKKTYTTDLQDSGFGGGETKYQKLDGFLSKMLNQALASSPQKLP
jgi:cell division protein FtsL